MVTYTKVGFCFSFGERKNTQCCLIQQNKQQKEKVQNYLKGGTARADTWCVSVAFSLA